MYNEEHLLKSTKYIQPIQAIAKIYKNTYKIMLFLKSTNA